MKYIIATTTLLCCQLVMAQEPDSTVTRVVVAPAVDVTVSPLLNSVGSQTVPVTILPAQLIKSINPTQVSDVLQLSPGVFVKDYGGIGGVKSISVRGGAASQTLVLLDGMSLNTAQNGQADLGVVPISFVNEVFVKRGGASSTEGANALTGVVRLSLQVPDSTMASAKMQLGSFSEWRVTAIGATKLFGDVRIGLTADALGSAGSYPFFMSYDGAQTEVDRTNGDVLSISAMMRIQDSNQWSVDVLARSTDRGVPGAVVEGNTGTPQARLNEDDFIGIAKLTIVRSESVQGTLRASARYLVQNYRDPQAQWAGVSGIDDNYTTRDFSLSSDVVHYSDLGVWKGLATASYVDLQGKSLVGDEVGFVERASIGIGLSWEYSFFDDDLITEVSARFDSYSDMGSALSPSIGFRYKISNSVALRSNYSYNFRPPSFNELYYLNYGNRNLKPERSNTIGLGSVITPLNWLVFEADLFAMFTENLIVSVPVNPIVTSAQNVGLAQTVGAELSARTSFFGDKLQTMWSYTIQKAQDATGRTGLDGTWIPYVPPEIFSVACFYDNGLFFSNLRWNYTSYRYAQPGSEITSLLQPYHIVSGAAGIHGIGSVSEIDIQLQMENIFDARYDVVRGFPMPGRLVRVVFGVRI